MSETKAPEEPIRVNDKRRFNPDGSNRESVTEHTMSNSEKPEALDSDFESTDEFKAANPIVEQLEQDLQAARKRVDDLARAYQASEKDREDFKVRVQRERDRMIDVEKSNIATVLLEAIDELDLCLEKAPDDPLVKGVKLVRQNLMKKAESLGLKRVEVVGLTFDPRVAEAADIEVTPIAADDQRIVAEVRAGYRVKDQIVRPARVRVAKYVKPADA